ncbi:NAD-dependent epimerase/dehydratase family protein [Devosia sp. CN2-171]|uniref:NAD-dependent epimerase/dehydratase family protein n=1 Tax=Devosia sp. CN2-171 TaxID=3400909 RepID=UPI003BF8548F
MPDRLLITGGSGFIGAEVVSLALKAGLEVRNLDIAEPRAEQHKPLWRRVDIRDAAAVSAAVAEFDPHRVLHLASDIDVNIRTLEEFKTTINGTSNVLAALPRAQSLKSFVHTSTQFVVKPGVEPTSERHYDPYTIYGEAKALTEQAVWAANLTVPWYILRPTIIWGPYHPSFATQIFRHMRTGRYLHPVSSRPIVRTFGYVTNVAEQMVSFSLLADPDPARHVFYLGDASINYDSWADAFSVGLTGRPAKRIPVFALKTLGMAGDLVKAVGLPSPIDSGRAFRMSTASKIDLKPTFDVVGPPSIDFDAGVGHTLAWLRQQYAA